MNTTAEQHTRSLRDLPRDQTLVAMEESKNGISQQQYSSGKFAGAPGNVSQGDFLAGLGIMDSQSKGKGSRERTQSV